MLRFLPGPLVGSISFLLLSFNLIFWGLFVIIISPFKYAIPHAGWRNKWTHLMHYFIELWADCVALIIWLTTKIEWDVRGVDNLKQKGWYLIVSNHQSWSDILVLDIVFRRKIPIIKFFMKKELIKVPVLGWLCFLMDFPFMHRHTKSYLKKHPEMKGKDIEITKKACEKFKSTPTSVMTFVEGTRFTEEKHARRHSPYKNLLQPKAGGLAFILAAMGDIFETMLDTTIVYEQKKFTFWEFLCGKVHRITVDVKQRPITQALIGDYQNDDAFRIQFQKQVNQLWQEKDKLIDVINQDIPKHEKSTSHCNANE